MKSKAHSKKCVDLGISVGLIDEQDTEESGKPPPVVFRVFLQHVSDLAYPFLFIYLCCRLPTSVFYLLLLPHYGRVSIQT